MQPVQASSKPYVVVVGIDYSETGELALERAFQMARERTPFEPHVIHVASTYGPALRVEVGHDAYALSLDEAIKQLDEYVHRRLTQYTKDHGTPLFDRVCAHQRAGAPAEEIAQLASDLEADLVVVGTHGRRGVRHLLLGSVAEGVVRMAPCPVLVVRPNTAGAEVPKIQPACPYCVEARKESGGKELWCPEHNHRHVRAHTHHYIDRRGTEANMPLLFGMPR